VTALLELEDVHARYGPVHALHGVSLAVGEGEIVAVLGANGAGKSTTLRAISNTVRREGAIRFDGRPLRGGPEAVAHRGIAHVPEGRGTFAELTVWENLKLGAYTRRGSLRSDFARIGSYFPWLEERRSQQAGTLSGGEQQMLSLARAIITQPKMLMVDELSLGLAPRLVGQLFDTLEKIKSDGTTILLVEQYVRYALRLADIVVILHKGRVAFIGEPGELAHEGKLVEAYLGGSVAETATAEAEEQEGPKRSRRASGGATSGARPKRKPSGPRGSTRRSSPS
jgi:branched-chain amino acid transport system ATP-binding protein